MLVNSVQASQPVTPVQFKRQNSEELKEKFTLLKDELGEKIINDDTEQSFTIGNSEFTIKEWDDFLQRFDKQEKAIQEEIKEEIENRMEQESDEDLEIDDSILAKLLEDINEDRDGE